MAAVLPVCYGAGELTLAPRYVRRLKPDASAESVWRVIPFRRRSRKSRHVRAL
jgi:hypothetical protein